MKSQAADFLIYDESTKTYREDPEQVVRDDVEKHYWLHVCRMIAKDWRLYIMLIPMLLVAGWVLNLTVSRHVTLEHLRLTVLNMPAEPTGKSFRKTQALSSWISPWMV